MVTVSALGLAASALQAASAAATGTTGGIAAPAMLISTSIKASSLALKNAKKAGKLPEWLQKEILRSYDIIKNKHTFEGVSNNFIDIAALVQTPDDLDLLEHSKSQDDMVVMSKYADRYEDDAYMIFKLTDGKVIELYDNLSKHSKETIFLASIFGSQGVSVLDEVGSMKFIQHALHMVKINYNDNTFHLLARLLTYLPIWMYFIILSIAMQYFLSRLSEERVNIV